MYMVTVMRASDVFFDVNLYNLLKFELVWTVICDAIPLIWRHCYLGEVLFGEKLSASKLYENSHSEVFKCTSWGMVYTSWTETRGIYV